MHANQLTVSVETVRELVDEQFPEWRGLTVMAVASQGTVNALFRVGEKFLARFPLNPSMPGRPGGGLKPRRKPLTMTHGDLIPGNVLVSRGRLAGVIDVGGMGPADPALDLARVTAGSLGAGGRCP